MRRLDKSVVAKRIYKWGKGQYVLKLKGTYHNAKQKLPILHKKCGRIFYMNESDFKRGRRCSYCYGHKRHTKEYIRKGIAKLGKGHYKLLLKGKYINDNQKLPILHKDCGKVYKACWAKFQSGRRCPYCYGHKRHSQRYIASMINKLGHEDYVLVDRYKNSATPMRIYHKKCHRTFKVRWSDFYRGQRCPHCSHSLGEDYLGNLLCLTHFHFIHKYITSCYRTSEAKRQGDYLHIDFYDPRLRVGIELDGQQHQHPIEYFGGMPTFIDQLRRDRLKDHWCYKNHIALIRVKLWKNWFGKQTKKGIKNYFDKSIIPFLKIREKQINLGQNNCNHSMILKH